MSTQKGKNSEKVIYLGDDKTFWTSVSQRFVSTYEDIEWEFIQITPEKNQIGQSYFPEILRHNPKIIYIDFCVHTDQMINLCEIMSRDNTFEHIPLVGFSEDKESIRQYLSAGSDFIFVKGGEFHDIVYAPMCVAFPKKVKKPDFAKAEFVKEIDLIDDFRVGFIAPTYMHIEGNLTFKKGEVLELNTEIPTKNVPSKKFAVKTVSKSNQYYDYQFNYDLDFRFVDEPVFNDDDYEMQLSQVSDEKERAKIIKNAKHDRQQKIAEFEDLLKRSRKKHKDWVIHNIDPGSQKKTKVLIVDQFLRVLDSENNVQLDKQPYAFRCQTKLRDGFPEIEKIKPGIIAIQLLDDFPPEEEESLKDIIELRKQGIDVFEPNPADPQEDDQLKGKMMEDIPALEKSSLTFLSNLLKTIKTIENYAPILVLFRCYFQSSKALQESYHYPMIVTHDAGISLDVISNLAKIYETKQDEKFEKLIKAKVTLLKQKDPQKYQRLSYQDFIEKRYFIKKRNPLSFCSLRAKVNINSISESELFFSTDMELPQKTFRVDYPLEMSIHLIPIEEGKLFLDNKGEKQYRALIHSISETDKKTLRRYVNEVFFEPLMEKRAEEEAAYKELHDSKLKERESQSEVEEQLEQEKADELLGRNRVDE